MGPAGRDGRAGEWRRNPLVGGMAAAVGLVALVGLLSRLCCRGGEETPVVGESVTVSCRQCKSVHEVSREQLGLDEGVSDDAFQERAVGVPCPNCGEADGTIATFCPKCRRPFAGPAAQEELKAFRCPHCGESPWTR